MEVMQANRQHSELIDKLLRLRREPIAVKLVEPGGAVPDGAYRPKADGGRHIALCQAFALSRRNGRTVYMRREDHWCWNPLLAFGHIKCLDEGDPGFDVFYRMMGNDTEAAKAFVGIFAQVPTGKYEGILTAPLSKADFVPDLWLIYCDNGQMRTILRAVKSQTGQNVKSEFDAIDSCFYSVIPPVLTGEYRITLPDPGEYERALTDVSNIIFSVPSQRFDEFLAGAKQSIDMHLTDADFYMDMKDDFARPPFYNELFRAWGLEEGEDWIPRR